MTDQRGSIDFERIEKSHRISGKIRYSVTGFRTIRFSVATLIDCEQSKVWRQERQHAAEGEPRIRPSVEEQDSFPAMISAFAIVKAKPRR
jgi:hypothetical protein